MKLSTWARLLRTGTLLVEPPSSPTGEVAAHARMSSADQRADSDCQVARLAADAAAGLGPSGVVAEVGSASKRNRLNLRRLLGEPEVATVAVEHRDRLPRFGVEYVEAALASQGRRIVVLDEGEVADDLVRVVEAGASVCARLCGRRSARRRAQGAVAAAGEVGA